MLAKGSALEKFSAQSFRLGQPDSLYNILLLGFACFAAVLRIQRKMSATNLKISHFILLIRYEKKFMRKHIDYEAYGLDKSIL